MTRLGIKSWILSFKFIILFTKNSTIHT